MFGATMFPLLFQRLFLDTFFNFDIREHIKLQIDATRSPTINKLLAKNVPQIIEKIFLSLDFHSFKNCIKVNSSWKQLLISDTFKKKWKVVYHQEILDLEIKLLWASQTGHMSVVEKLISCAMIDVNCVGRVQDKSPLHYTALLGRADMVQVLLDAGADPYKQDVFGRTPLYCSVLVFRDAVVGTLISNMTNLNQSARSGRTPLHAAVINSNLYQVKLLLDGGAEPNLADREGSTPLHRAVTMDRNDSFSVVKLLIESGADVNMANSYGHTPLHGAALNCRNEVVKFLLEKGADPYSRNGDGHTPLSLALEHGCKCIENSEVVRMLSFTFYIE